MKRLRVGLGPLGARLRRSGLAGLALCLSLALSVQPVLAQGRSLSLIRDTEIEQALRHMATPLLKSGGLVPEAVQIVLVNEDVLNAFVAGGQNIFLYTGFLMEVDPYELIGVTAHEIGHIAGGHLARRGDAIANASTIATLTTLLGLAAAIGSGRSDVGTGLIAGGQEAARRTYLAYNRGQEGGADQFAMAQLEAVGWSARGLLSFLDQLTDQQLIPQERQIEYVLTHPLSSNRVEAIRAFLTQESKFADAPLPDEFYDLHARMQAKLFGYLRPEQALRRYPADDPSIVARYGRAIALYQKGEIQQALDMMDGLIAAEPENPYFPELRGQILFENGRSAEAAVALRRAVTMKPEAGLMRASLGHALLETYDDALVPEAIEHLQTAARLERRSAFVWRLLASAYSRTDQQPQLAYARAEEALARGDVRAARFHADNAEQMLPTGSPEWLRAQDIRTLVESHSPQGGRLRAAPAADPAVTAAPAP